MTRKATRRPAPSQVYEGITAAQLKMTCPTCGAVIKAQATVETFGLPPSRGMRSKKARRAYRRARLTRLAKQDDRTAA